MDIEERKYSVKSKSCRWPFQEFFNILDLAGINAWVLYKETTGVKISRQEFLFQLAVELAATYQESREKKIIPKSPININKYKYNKYKFRFTRTKNYIKVNLCHHFMRVSFII